MKNTFGMSIEVTLFGESHGAVVGAVADGLPPGIPVSDEKISDWLLRRRPDASLDTARIENDRYQILSGVYKGKTTGAPLCIVIPNEDVKSADYRYGPARPSHADYAAFCKYHGYEDYRGGGHFSGRVTAALVALGAIFSSALEELDIAIGTHILKCGGISDRTFEDVRRDIGALKKGKFPVLDEGVSCRMSEKIREAKAGGDSVGGVTQTAVCGLPPGVGEPWFDSVESVLSRALFGVGGIKGVEFGLGFSFADTYASKCNDLLEIKNGKITTKTNNNGGINGGITNGMPIIFQCAVKPTPSISRQQHTVDFLSMTETDINIAGRHDPAIVRRICPVIDSIAAIVISDLLTVRFGTDFLTGHSRGNRG